MQVCQTKAVSAKLKYQPCWKCSTRNLKVTHVLIFPRVECCGVQQGCSVCPYVKSDGENELGSKGTRTSSEAYMVMNNRYLSAIVLLARVAEYHLGTNVQYFLALKYVEMRATPYCPIVQHFSTISLGIGDNMLKCCGICVLGSN